MGKELINALANFQNCKLVGAVTRPASPDLGRDAGLMVGQPEAGIKITNDLKQAAKEADVLIDFTVPEATLQAAALCARTGQALITGTTGLSEAQQKALTEAADHAAIVQASNFSPGIYWMEALIKQVAAFNADTAEELDVEILETHHRHKIDAPSGTALHLGQVAADALGRNFKETALLNRQTTRGAKALDAIGFASIRSGDAVGKHSIIFSTPGESLHITHQSFSRNAFARGAIQAAIWASRQKPGLYNMQDVMGGAVLGGTRESKANN